MNDHEEHRLEDAIAFLVARAGKPLSRTALIKLLYFADLRSYETNRRPITGLPWIWHLYGPFATGIYDAVNRMNAHDEIKVDVGTTPYGNPEYRLSRGSSAGFYQVLSEAERDRLAEVLTEFGGFNAMKLRDLSYQTLPMERVAQRGDPLDFSAYLGPRQPPRYQPDLAAPPSPRISG